MNYEARELDKLFLNVANNVQWGGAFAELLERGENRTPHTADFEKEYGILKDEYADAITECREAFEAVAGMSYGSFRANFLSHQHKKQKVNEVPLSQTIHKSRFERLQSLLEDISSETGLCPNACLALMMSQHTGRGHCAKLEAEHSISEGEYLHTYRSVHGAFIRRSLYTFSEFVTAEQLNPKKSNGSLYPTFEDTAAKQLPTLSHIMSVAKDCMTDDEFFSVSTLNFYCADSKLTPNAVASMLERSKPRWATKIYNPAKKRLKEELAREQLGLETHPFLRKRESYDPDEDYQRYKTDIKYIDKSFPEAKTLYWLSSTLFEPRHHYMVFFELLHDLRVPRNRSFRANKSGIKLAGYKDTVDNLIETLKLAASFEPNSRELLSTIDAMKTNILVKGDKISLARGAIHKVDDRKINFKNPAIRRIYEIALRETQGTDFASFCTCDLYDAEYKLTKQEALKLFGYKEEPLKRCRTRARTNIRRAIEGTDDEDLLAHPVLQKKDFPSDRDINARAAIAGPEFHDFKAQLSQQERDVFDLASVSFNPRQFYCYVISQFSKPRISFAQIDRNIQNPKDTAKLLTRVAKEAIGRYLGNPPAALDIAFVSPSND